MKARRRTALLLLPALSLAACGRQEPAPTASASAPAAAARAESGAPVTVDTVKVVEQKLARTIRLPGELAPFQSVALYPRVAAFVERIEVDRGSRVRRGQLLVRLSAPEMASQQAEAEAKLQAVRAQRTEADARLASDDGTYQRLKAAAETPGVVAGNDLIVAQKTVEAARARVQALASSEKAARAAVQATQQMEDYLRITAPFDGVIVERSAHPGSLAGAAGAPGAVPMLRLEQVSRLRLVVAVPEVDAGAIGEGRRLEFTVPAFPGETFRGVVRRSSHSLDPRTRTLPVELDVANPSGRLAPGMFPEVVWPVERAKPTLFLPASAVATTLERTFVIRARDGKAEWISVRRGATAGDLVEVFGAIKAGDDVVRRASDELRAGTAVRRKEP